MSEAAKTAIRQLEAARQVVLADAAHYSVIIPGILPIIGPQAEVEVRRWGAEFLAEAFASPLLSSLAKEGLSIQALSLLNQLLEVPDQDDIVLKSVVQTAASVYALVFKYMYVPLSYMPAVDAALKAPACFVTFRQPRSSLQSNAV
jgi:symplekin